MKSWLKRFFVKTESKSGTRILPGRNGADESSVIRRCKPDDVIDEEYEEKNGVLTRRSFLFMLPGVVTLPKIITEIPKVVKPTIEYSIFDVVPVIEAPVAMSGCMVSSSSFMDFLAPGAIEINRYQKEIFNMVRRKYVFGDDWKKEQRRKIVEAARELNPMRLPS